VSVTRPQVVPDESPASAEFEVDGHGVQSLHDEPAAGSATAVENIEPAPVIVVGWTPQEATQLICALWNFGMLVWGPEWAAHPAETEGWNISAAQLLDATIPKGTGGFVELGAGLIMVGNGLAMMTARRVPIIQRGPRPMWARRPPADPDAPTEAAPTPTPKPSGGGSYKMPADLAPQPAENDALRGIGL
jgi:hypothetical protein